MINHIYQLVSPGVFSIEYASTDLADKVILRPQFMALCHADQRYFLGQRSQDVLRKKLPMALIHECCGRVLQDPTGTFAPGARVVAIPNSPQSPDPIISENYRRDSRFLSSGYDGFMREYIDLPADRLVSCDGVPDHIAAITEFVSVTVQAARRFDRLAHARRDRVGIWGDGSMAFVLACTLRSLFPQIELHVVGKNARKLSMFSFVGATHFADDLPQGFSVDHAFECAGGEGSYYAIDDIIRTIEPQGAIILLGVSENKVAINTRDVLEKGLTLAGSSRSGREDFVEAIRLMGDPAVQNRLNRIISIDDPVCQMGDIERVFRTDLNTPFKTVFEWRM
ncbi:alcohol dehydrogenase catalytic domain-containing protein [bacterium 210820-DFI.6.52]|nr:alcohol dehydrogenase catalytic domain-containing protein [bacterium 210820-DFI.6.52]